MTWVLLALIVIPLVLLAAHSVGLLIRLLSAGRQDAPAPPPAAVTAAGAQQSSPGTAGGSFSAPAADSGRICRVCDQPVLATARTCWRCGTPLAR